MRILRWLRRDTNWCLLCPFAVSLWLAVLGYVGAAFIVAFVQGLASLWLFSIQDDISRSQRDTARSAVKVIESYQQRERYLAALSRINANFRNN